MADKIYYRKLVRDNIPDVIRDKGSECEVRTLSEEAFAHALLRKVTEEASAFPNLADKQEVVQELADLIDVIEEVKKVQGISEEELDAARAASFEKKGGFEKRFFLEWSSDDGYRTNETTS